MTTIGFLQLLVYFGSWTCSVFIFLAAIASFFVSGYTNYYGIVPVVMYYSYRLLFPAKPWDLPRKLSFYITENYPYFSRQDVVFEQENEIKEDSKSMLCYHPHGVLTCGFIINGVTNRVFGSSKIRWLVADAMFNIPLGRDIIRWHSSEPVSKSTMQRNMKAGQNIALIPGGFEEATVYEYDHDRIFLKNRCGFIKYALKYGYKVYPVYTFGEEKTYYTLPYLLEFRLWLNKFKIPTVFFCGLWGSFLPFRDVDLITVVGTPIEMPTITEPTKEQVEKYHAIYISELEKLYNKHKPSKTSTLEVC